MTNIILHGILAKEFGENFKMQIYKAANVIKAIDVNRRNFNKRIFELSREGLNYTMIVDGKKITELEAVIAEIDTYPGIKAVGGKSKKRRTKKQRKTRGNKNKRTKKGKRTRTKKRGRRGGSKCGLWRK